MPALTQEALRSHMRYDQESGHLIWVAPTGHRAKAGQSAGSKGGEGYRSVSIFGRRYLIHHLVWLYHHGELPPKGLDIALKDGDRSNNRIENLRLVNRTENLAGGDGRRNPILPGVTKTPFGRYVAAIHVNRRRTYIGTFDTPDEAHGAFKVAHVAMFGEASKFHPDHPRQLHY